MGYYTSRPRQLSHFLLQDPRFFQLLLRVDQDFAQQTRVGGCVCGGVLHRGDYPRKPRGCLPVVRSDFESRFSFCCSVCRKRTTSMGDQVYVRLLDSGETLVRAATARGIPAVFKPLVGDGVSAPAEPLSDEEVAARWCPPPPRKGNLPASL